MTAKKKTTKKVAKKPATKAATKKTTPPKTKTLYFEKMSKKEVTVMKAMNGNGKGKRTVLTLSEISDATGWDKAMGQKKANWTVRNAIRRILRCGWIERYGEHGDGTYRVSQFGRKQMKKPTPLPIKAKPAKKKTTAKKVTKKATKKPAKKKAASAKKAATVLKPPSNVFVPPKNHQPRAQA